MTREKYEYFEQMQIGNRQRGNERQTIQERGLAIIKVNDVRSLSKYRSSELRGIGNIRSCMDGCIASVELDD